MNANLRTNAAYPNHPCAVTIVDLVLGFEHAKNELFSETTLPLIFESHMQRVPTVPWIGIADILSLTLLL